MSPNAQFVLFLLVAPFLITAAYASWSAAPWVPSRKRTRKLLLDSIQLKAGETFVELGCGDGRILFDFARAFPKTHCIGYELSLPVYLIAKIRSFFYPNATILYKSIFRYDGSAEHAFLFLSKEAYRKLSKILLKPISKTKHVYTEAWPLAEQKANHVYAIPNTEKIYHYIVK